ncbi:hypothetical protein EDB82DRAFT_287461 [Fusarium venenatum]|uniref:uncharacterized protein n=1 Tax=Fusarium venenatum TaxID=56646 RepID=UPI001D841FDF|nr:hypothetical protein EDB82DRAFT_287461 [Fusarium venenatum]
MLLLVGGGLWMVAGRISEEFPPVSCYLHCIFTLKPSKCGYLKEARVEPGLCRDGKPETPYISCCGGVPYDWKSRCRSTVAHLRG